MLIPTAVTPCLKVPFYVVGGGGGGGGGGIPLCPPLYETPLCDRTLIIPCVHHSGENIMYIVTK